ncbi:MAG: nickel pincer cofactor biosynthesis protein LarC [Schwartzia sp. (in: firmicutes)]
MKALYLDCFSGLSGNMLLGAFLAAGVPLAFLEGELQKLFRREAFRIHVSRVPRCGIDATYVEVEDLSCAHDHGGHGDHDHGGQGGHPHRTMGEIRELLTSSSLKAAVQERVLAIFSRLAEAEGKVHGLPKDEVRFHEVGAVDSIVDIVGTALALDYLGIEKVFVSRVNTGSGYVDCAHGRMMVPAPATAELLRGIPFYHNEETRELTTPTGAAVVCALAEYADNLPMGFQPETIAYGAGTWALETPNVLRVYVGTYEEKVRKQRCILETNIDDMNPQNYEYVFEQLFDAGALDVWLTPIIMKKGRPAVMLSVLTDASCRARCEGILFRETTTLGLRVMPVAERLEVSRRMGTVKTMYGEVSCKISTYDGAVVSVSAEYADCRRLAKEKGVPLKVVRQAALVEMHRRLGA